MNNYKSNNNGGAYRSTRNHKAPYVPSLNNNNANFNNYNHAADAYHSNSHHIAVNNKLSTIRPPRFTKATATTISLPTTTPADNNNVYYNSNNAATPPPH
jgi:hypothetical protein